MSVAAAKALAIVASILLAFVVALGVYAWGLSAKADAAVAGRSAAETARDSWKLRAESAEKTVGSHATAAETDKRSIATLTGELNACAATKEAQRKAATQALDRLDAELADANALIAAQFARRPAAQADAECAVCIDRPVCAALRADAPADPVN